MQHPACPMGTDVCVWQCTLDVINKATPGSPRGSGCACVCVCVRQFVCTCKRRLYCRFFCFVIHFSSMMWCKWEESSYLLIVYAQYIS